MNKDIKSPSFFIGKGAVPELISFGSGEPDLPPPKSIFSALEDYASFKYGEIPGLNGLRKALSEQYPKAGLGNFVITNGASEALDLIFRYIATKGKRVLIPRPYYYSYPYFLKFAGLEPVYYDLVNGKIDLRSFVKNLKGCVAVLINSPSNPTGSVQDVPVLKEIEKITQRKGIFVVSDEVYKDLIYERENYLIKGPHVITVNSFSKTFAMCGFRVGYLYSTDKTLVQAAIEMKTHTSMNTSILSQDLAIEAMKVPRNYLETQVKIWKDRRDTIYTGLKEMGLKLWKPEGAFYVLPELKNSAKAVNDLYYKHQVIVYDGAWFGAPNRIRLSYALDTSKIKEGLSRIQTYLKSL